MVLICLAILTCIILSATGVDKGKLNVPDEVKEVKNIGKRWKNDKIIIIYLIVFNFIKFKFEYFLIFLNFIYFSFNKYIKKNKD